MSLKTLLSDKKFWLIIAILVISVNIYIAIDAPILYGKVTNQPIAVYYSISEGEHLKSSTGEILGSKQKYQVNFIKIDLKDPFTTSNAEVSINFENFSQEN